jgi:bifunctional non-homologous end joining protein LigD
MLATATDKLPKGKWVAEEKFDGHRMLVRVHPRVEGKTYSSNQLNVLAWSRLGNYRNLPKHLIEILSMLPPALYDGELVVPRGYSSNVTDLSNEKLLHYIAFDVVERHEDSVIMHPWQERRMMLEKLFTDGRVSPESAVRLSTYMTVRDWDHVTEMVGAIWDQGGEGIILKEISSRYEPGKRRKTWLKVKELQSECMTVIGFTPTQGEIMDRGEFACAVVEDPEGFVTVVKTLNDFELTQLNLQSKMVKGEAQYAEVKLGARKVKYRTNHPSVGRKLWIEYQSRTPDGSYRHPRWDHWDSAT